MIALISPMGLILASWLILFLMFSGLGFIVQRFLNQAVDSGTLWLDSFWFGWAFSLLILQLWHFVFPVNDVILIIFLLIAGVSIVLHRQSLVQVLKRLKNYRLFLILFSIVLLWLANRAIDMPTAFDTGFRDMQAVMWINTYPIVPGLNNLFSSLAFNHSVYLYDALLDVSVWSGRAYHIATGLLFVVFLAQAIWSAVQLYYHRDGAGVRWSWILMTLMIPYLLFQTIGRGGITHFLTDTPVEFLGILSVAYVLDFLQFDDGDRYSIRKIAILVLTGFTVKQSFIILGISLLVLVFLVWLRRVGHQRDVGGFARLWLPLIAYGLLVGVPWMARGVVTSGYIAYPQSIGRFEVDWAEPPELIEDRQEMLATNTRLRYGDPNEVLSSWDWVVPWFEHVSSKLFEFVFPVGLSFLALVAYLLGRSRSREDKSNSKVGFWIVLPTTIMIMVWFLSAPNIKYIQYVLWVQVAVLVILAVLAWSQISWGWRIHAVFAVAGLSFLYAIYIVLVTQAFPLPAGPDDGFYPRPVPPIKVVDTQSGLELNVPDSRIKQCWNIPLPCTPTPRTRVFERVPGDLRHGFGLVPKELSSTE